jgi:hypothetical protein
MIEEDAVESDNHKSVGIRRCFAGHGETWIKPYPAKHRRPMASKLAATSTVVVSSWLSGRRGLSHLGWRLQWRPRSSRR